LRKTKKLFLCQTSNNGLDIKSQGSENKKVKGKQEARLPFKQETLRETKNLKLILKETTLVSQLDGPRRTASLKESKYYTVFIDCCTKMCWIYFSSHS